MSGKNRDAEWGLALSGKLFFIVSEEENRANGVMLRVIPVDTYTLVELPSSWASGNALTELPGLESNVLK